MNTFCIAAAYLGANMCENQTALSAIEQSFIQHLAEHGISYGTKEEYQFRLDIFKRKDAEYREINSNPENTFTVGHNMFSTWTDSEYKRLLGYRGPQTLPESEVEVEAPTADSVDWRAAGAVNPVKNQAQCGSCWAFSATAAIEGAHKIQQGVLVSLSEQQIVDCDKNGGDYGCNGGWQSGAMKYVQGHAQDFTSEYPYTGRDGTCHAVAGHVKVTAINNVAAGSSAALLAAIAKQPVSVTVEADTSVFQGYRSGVLNSSACGTNLDHAITAVGYGVENGQQYYLVRNSWGSGWGDQGYIKIATQATGKGICGIQQVSVFPTVASA
jgi:KDEL-tailed cysteine endopeptidase